MSTSSPGFVASVRAALARAIAPEPRRTAKRNAFAGADFGRLAADWIHAWSRSADQETRYDLRILRNRARDLDRNSPWGSRYTVVLAEKLVGAGGIRLKAKNYLADGSDLHRDANAGIEDAWEDWSRPENCDVTRKLSFNECLSLATAQWGTDGEILIRQWEGPQFGPYGFMLELLDPDLLDEKLNQEATGSGANAQPMIHQGVEYDAFGAPAAYWLWTRHPNDGAIDRKHVRVPADLIIHAFIPRRAQQSRGIPHLAAAMATVKMLDGYIEAELVAARTASAKMGAIEDLPNGDGPAPNVDPTAETNYADIPMEADPGSLMDLRGRGHLALWDPQHPTTAFPAFTTKLAQFTSMALGMSYGTLTGDLSQANYGSLRVGMLDERDHWKRLQQFIITHVVDRIYRRWLKMALTSQKISGVRDFNYQRYLRVRWQPRGFDWIDPLKDVQGELLEVAAGVNSLTRMCGERGLDFEEMIQERAEEIAILKAYGVPSTLSTSITDRPTDENDPGGADDQAAAAVKTPADEIDSTTSTAGGSASKSVAKAFLRALRKVS